MYPFSTFILLLLFLGDECLVLGQDQTAPQSVEIVVDNSEKLEAAKTKDQNVYAQTLDALLSNPALSAGLQSGAGAINRSIDALMESLFYSLLDNEIKVPIGAHTDLAMGYFRDVYTAGARGYVVVDRFKFGPQFSREVGRIGRYPTSLGAEGKVELVDIYLKSDAERIAQDQEASTFDYWVNNLLGLVPLFSAALPPSFNPIELHDPLRQLRTPGSFPADIKSFKNMPTHSIRSYILSGVVRLPITLQAIKSDLLASAFDQASDKLAIIPYTIFSGGSYRINVLKRSKNIAWVGLSKTKELGHGISSLIGDYLYAFSRVIPELTLSGVKTPIFPVDSSISHKLLNQYDHLYEFDLSDKKARHAYLAAVKGDFEPATEISKESRKVVFHFTRKKLGDQYNSKQFNQLFVYNKASASTTERARLEITDKRGVFNVLEGTDFQSESEWNLLVGEEKKIFTQSSEMEVLKSKQDHYSWKDKKKKGASLTLSLEITDRYTFISEYQEYIQLLEDFSGIDLTDLPDFKQHIDTQQDGWKAEVRGKSMLDYHLIPHTPEPVAGKFNSRATLYLSYANLEYLAKLPKTKILEGIQTGFSLSEEMIATFSARSPRLYGIFYKSIYHFLDFFTISSSPVSTASSAHQAYYAQQGLMKSSRSPLEFRDQLMDFFSTSEPAKFMKALRLWLKDTKWPVSLTLGSNPLNEADPGIKQLFGSINGKTFTNGITFPDTSRYRVAQSKLNAFSPTHLKDNRKRLQLQTASFSDQSSTDEALLFLSIDSLNFPDDAEDMKVYLKVQQAGKVQFGKLVLVEKILELPIVRDEERLGMATASFFLTGEQSSINSFLLQQALDFGGEFKVSISISTKSHAWSNITHFNFKFENNQIIP